MYDTLIAFHILELIQESLEKISIRFSGISHLPRRSSGIATSDKTDAERPEAGLKLGRFTDV